MPDTGTLFLQSAAATFRSQKQMAERAVGQLSFEQLRHDPGGDANSVAVIMKHLAGNMLSRWTDFLTTDGDKPDRDRDSEFVDRFESREALMARWEQGWSRLFETLDRLAVDDLVKTVTIRGQPETVVSAVHRQISHYAYHTGQIVSQCKALAGDDWAYLTIPRGQSEQYNQRVRRGDGPG